MLNACLCGDMPGYIGKIVPTFWRRSSYDSFLSFYRYLCIVGKGYLNANYRICLKGVRAFVPGTVIWIENEKEVEQKNSLNLN
jgi:hypothetical protein